MYSIKETAEKIGIEPNTLRFYEKKKLITPKRSENNYREYTTEDIHRLQLIVLYRKMGFSIEAIQRLLAESGGRGEKLGQFVRQFELLNAHIHALAEIRETLAISLEEMLNDTYEEETGIERMAAASRRMEEREQWDDVWDFDHWAKHYDEDIRVQGEGLPFYQSYDEVLSYVAEQVELPGCIVEIGIGTGNLAREILTRGKAEYYGVDQSINMLVECKKKCPQVQLRKGTFLQLPFGDHFCDTVVTSYAFHHCDETEKRYALQEMKRVLKSRGTVVIADLMFENGKAREEFEEKCSEAEKEELLDEYFGNVDEIEEQFLAMGYTCEKKQIDKLIWVITAKK